MQQLCLSPLTEGLFAKAVMSSGGGVSKMLTAKPCLLYTSGRLEDIPLTTAYAEPMQQSCAPFNDLFGLAYQSAAIGYCFAKQSDHMPTTAIPDAAARQRLADEGQPILEKAVAAMDMPHVVEQMRKLEGYNNEVEKTLSLIHI